MIGAGADDCIREMNVAFGLQCFVEQVLQVLCELNRISCVISAEIKIRVLEEMEIKRGTSQIFNFNLLADI